METFSELTLVPSVGLYPKLYIMLLDIYLIVIELRRFDFQYLPKIERAYP